MFSAALCICFLHGRDIHELWLNPGSFGLQLGLLLGSPVEPGAGLGFGVWIVTKPNSLGR